jgi:Arc/MetJ family transcription regulator
MRNKVEIEVDVDLVQEAIRRYHLADAREAVHLALRMLLGEPDYSEGEQHDDDYDEFSDLSAWEPRRSSDTG